MRSVSIEQASAGLLEIISQLGPEEVCLITQDNKPVARLVAVPDGALKRRVPGSAKGLLTIVAEDDEHLRDFGEYLS